MNSRDFDIIVKGDVNWEMYRGSTVLITGATGRLGRYIFESLVEINKRECLGLKVIGLARSERKSQEFFGELLGYSYVSMLYQDVNSAIEYEGDIDYIFHTAGPSAPRDFETSADTLWAHVNGTHNVLECASRHNTKRVFYVSTVEIYGEWKRDEKIKETDMGVMQHLNSRACYPEAKRLCETMFTTYKQQYGISFCGVRLCHTLGPGVALDDGRGFAEFMNCVLKNQDIVLHSDGGAMRTYTYVADAVNAMFLIMDKGKDMFYNVANIDNLISIRDLAAMMVKLLPDRTCKVIFSEEATKLKYLPFKLAIMDVSEVKELGWKPVTGIEKMFKWTLESFL